MFQKVHAKPTNHVSPTLPQPRTPAIPASTISPPRATSFYTPRSRAHRPDALSQREQCRQRWTAWNSQRSRARRTRPRRAGYPRWRGDQYHARGAPPSPVCRCRGGKDNLAVRNCYMTWYFCPKVNHLTLLMMLYKFIGYQFIYDNSVYFTSI